MDSGIVTSRLRRSRPSHAPLAVKTVDLVEVRQDADRGQYLWDLVHQFPLGAPELAAPITGDPAK
ncbi:hypothetical protein ABIA39_008980 [Nocardia sp. GAS34]|uniref:hypothetical protein n=1 Tax=Nocardia sp. GAS34 TaxID=3156305 RepID=UPI003D229053